MAHADVGDLRLRIVDSETFPLDERSGYVVRPIAGRLLAVLYRDELVGRMLTMSLLERAHADSLGLPDDAMMRSALDNVSDHAVESLEVIQVTDKCRIFVFQDEDSVLSGRMLDLPSLLATVEDQLSKESRASAEIGPHGVLVALPRQTLLMVFIVDGGELIPGAATLAANAAAHFDDDDEEAVSPWLYWVVGDEVEEMLYDVDDEGDVTEMGLPDALMALVPA